MRTIHNVNGTAAAIPSNEGIASAILPGDEVSQGNELMKTRTCKFDWTDNMAVAEKLGREIARKDLDAGVKMLDEAKASHKKHVKYLQVVANVKAGGVRPLSRMHPDHPVRRDFLTHEVVNDNQKFVP